MGLSFSAHIDAWFWDFISSAVLVSLLPMGEPFNFDVNLMLADLVCTVQQQKFWLVLASQKPNA